MCRQLELICLIGSFVDGIACICFNNDAERAGYVDTNRAANVRV